MFHEIVISTHPYWLIDVKPFFHHAIAQCITQQISFKQSRLIRQKLYTILGDPYDQAMFDNADDITLSKCGINDSMIQILRLVSEQINPDKSDNDNLDAIHKIRGVGNWTIKSIKLMRRSAGFENIILFEDYYIRKRLGEFFGKTIVSQSDAKTYVEKLGKIYQLDCGIISLFFWRITSDGIRQIDLGRVNLDRTHFV